MKSTFTSKGLQTLVAMVLLVGGIFVTGRVEAQSSVLDDITLSQQHNWVTESEALAIVSNALETTTVNLEQQVPGSPLYRNYLFHIHYYKAILDGLGNNLSTESSAQTGLEAMVQEGYGTDINTYFTMNDLVNLYQEAVDMLTF